jgi:hypothetical protein
MPDRIEPFVIGVDAAALFTGEVHAVARSCATPPHQP